MGVVLFVVLIETACAFGGCLALFATGSADDQKGAARVLRAIASGRGAFSLGMAPSGRADEKGRACLRDAQRRCVRDRNNRTRGH